MDGADPQAELDRIRDGLRLFNERYFFEAHEALEEVWHKEHGESRLFLQGLIQICAGFHHYQNGNLRGAADLLKRGTEKMRKYPDQYLGLDAAHLIALTDACRERMERMRDGSEAEGPMEVPTIVLPLS